MTAKIDHKTYTAFVFKPKNRPQKTSIKHNKKGGTLSLTTAFNNMWRKFVAAAVDDDDGNVETDAIDALYIFFLFFCNSCAQNLITMGLKIYF